MTVFCWIISSLYLNRRGTKNIFLDRWRVRDYNCIFFSSLPSSLCVAPCFGTDCPNNITYSSFVLIGCQKMSWINRWTSIHSNLKAGRGGRFPCRGTGFPPASPLVCAGLLQICIQDIWADCISLVWFEWTALSCWGLCADS